MKTLEDYKRIVAEHPIASKIFAKKKSDEEWSWLVTFQVEFDEKGNAQLNEPIKPFEEMNDEEKDFELLRRSIVNTLTEFCYER